MEQTELDLREILYILRRRFWLIVALPVLAAVAAGLVSVFFLDPVYSASTTLWVINDGKQINYNELMLNRNLTKTYTEVAKSRAVMADVINRLQLQGMTVQQLQAKVTVSPVRDTEVLSISVQDGDPVMAAKLADAVVESFKGQLKVYVKENNVMVMDQAMVPLSPIKPRPLLNVVLAMILGAMVAVASAVLVEYLDTTVKTPEDVNRHLGLPVLGLIPIIESEETPGDRARARVRGSKAKTVID